MWHLLECSTASFFFFFGLILGRKASSWVELQLSSKSRLVWTCWQVTDVLVSCKCQPDCQEAAMYERGERLWSHLLPPPVAHLWQAGKSCFDESWEGQWLVAERDIEPSGVQRGCLNPPLITGLLRRSHEEELLLTCLQLPFHRRQTPLERWFLGWAALEGSWRKALCVWD